MRRIMIFAAIAAALLPECTKQDSGDSGPTEADRIAACLSGRFTGSVYLSAMNLTETEEITFTPYSSVKNVLTLENGKIYMYGTAVVTKYYNDHLMEVTRDCFYSVCTIPYVSAQTVSFYPRSGMTVSGAEDRRTISDCTASSFTMYVYGTASATAKRFVKQ